MPLAQFPNSPAPAQDFVQTPAHFPEVPAEILQRFPSAHTWNDDLTLWYKKLVGAIGDQQDSVTSVVNANDQTLGNVIVRQGELTAMIETETTARIDADGILAQRIVTVSALAGSSSHITVQAAPPGGPAVNDLWVNNSVPQTPVTYKWNGAAWIEVTEPISVAAVAAEQTARITADGFLEGKYTLTVIAGNVVTGMNITSSTGSGTNVSSVIFRATDFQIYNGVSGLTMFSVSGANVNLAGVLTVSTSGKVFTGTGTYANNNTPFYVDSSSNFSLGASLTWNGTTLTVSGSITATSGTIGGWNINASTLSKNNAVLDSAGQLFLGTANDIVYLSATDATYRLWVGNVTAGSAAFSVTKAGVLSATGATIAGTLTSTSGTIAGFTLNATGFTTGSGSSFVQIQSTGATIQFGTGGNQIAVYSAQGLVITNTAGVGTLAAFLGTTGGNNYLRIYNNASTLIFQVDATSATVSVTGAITATSVSANLSGSTGYAAGNLSGTYAALDGSAITSLNATNISSGTISNSRLPATISVSTLTASGTVSGSTVTSSGAVNGASGNFGSGEVACGAVRYSAHNANAISFGWDGSNVKVYVDGSVQGTIPNP